MVYCRTLPALTFPVTEWDLGTRLMRAGGTRIGTFRSDYDYEYEYEFWAREAWVLAVVDVVVAVASSQH